MGTPLAQAFEEIDAVSSFLREARSKLTEDWSPDPPPPSLAMSQYARVFSENVRSFSKEETQTLFTLVEHLLSDADDAVKDAVATGFLEGLLGLASAGSFDIRSVVQLLGPKSRKYCQEWDKFTGMQTSGL